MQDATQAAQAEGRVAAIIETSCSESTYENITLVALYMSEPTKLLARRPFSPIRPTPNAS